MAKVREEIECVYYTNGCLVKHPSGVEVFEPTAQLETALAALDAAIITRTLSRTAVADALAAIELAEEEY